MTSLLAFSHKSTGAMWPVPPRYPHHAGTVAAGWTVLLGLPLGIVLYLTGEPRLLYAPRLYRLLSLCVNVLRPAVHHLLIVMIPLTTLLTGTSLGWKEPFRRWSPAAPRSSPGWWKPLCARWSTARWRPAGRWAAALAAYLAHAVAESRAGLIAAVTVTAILLVDHTSMAGVIGGGAGLGDLAIRFGYQRFQTDVMVVTVLMLIALVQLLQMSGDRSVRYVSRK